MYRHLSMQATATGHRSLMPPYVPKYVNPKEAAQARARLKARLFWTAVAIPVVFAFLAFGYSDQAPDALRRTIIAVDRALGFPIAGLLSMIGR
jgi:hypothetical protein